MHLYCIVHFFHVELPAPILGQVERISASQIAISWKLRPHVNSYSITNYIVKYYALSTDARVRKSSEDLFRFLTTTETEVVIHDLDPGLRYSLSVAANYDAGKGNYTEEVTVECKCFPICFPFSTSVYFSCSI